MRTPVSCQQAVHHPKNQKKQHNSNLCALHEQRVVTEPAGTIHQYLAKLQIFQRQGGTK
jgi:hypothetical protein